MPRYLPKTLPYTLLAATALMAVATAGHAEDVTNARTAPLRTSTIKSGAAVTINVAAAGSVVVSGGTAIAQYSNNAVTNAGATS